jgi:hypothetical protein
VPAAGFAVALSGCTLHLDYGDRDEVCGNGRDDDLDGLVDCQDPDCDVTGVCSEDIEGTTCRDSRDNDGDGLIDTNDPGCWRPDFERCASTPGTAADVSLAPATWLGPVVEAEDPLDRSADPVLGIGGPGEAVLGTPLTGRFVGTRLVASVYLDAISHELSIGLRTDVATAAVPAVVALDVQGDGVRLRVEADDDKDFSDSVPLHTVPGWWELTLEIAGQVEALDGSPGIVATVAPRGADPTELDPIELRGLRSANALEAVPLELFFRSDSVRGDVGPLLGATSVDRPAFEPCGVRLPLDAPDGWVPWSGDVDAEPLGPESESATVSCILIGPESGERFEALRLALLEGGAIEVERNPLPPELSAPVVGWGQGRFLLASHEEGGAVTLASSRDCRSFQLEPSQRVVSAAPAGMELYSLRARAELVDLWFIQRDADGEPLLVAARGSGWPPASLAVRPLEGRLEGRFGPPRVDSRPAVSHSPLLEAQIWTTRSDRGLLEIWRGDDIGAWSTPVTLLRPAADRGTFDAHSLGPGLLLYSGVNEAGELSGLFVYAARRCEGCPLKLGFSGFESE